MIRRSARDRAPDETVPHASRLRPRGSHGAEKCPERYRVVEIPYGVRNEWVDNRELDIDMTFIVDREGFLAGAALYGSEAGTWIDFLTLVINRKIGGEELRNMIFAFPTQTYMIVSTLVPLLKK